MTPTPPASPTATPLAEGAMIGKYRIMHEVGAGGMCHVYEAEHVELRKTVAVKVLRAEYASQEPLVQRFLREGRAAARVRHRHAVNVLDVGVHEGTVFLVMELLRGEDLDARIQRCGALPIEETVDILLPVIAAIAAAHDAGVVHRDLKPANIFLAVEGHGAVVPRVVDFGISKIADETAQSLTGTEVLLGTPYYMAPEQIRSARDTGPASDQYALGVILYECLTGVVPCRGANVYNTLRLIARGRFAPPRARRAEIPEELEAVVLRAMALYASQRFGSVAEMGAALLPFASDEARPVWTREFGGVTPTQPAAVPDEPLFSIEPDEPRSVTLHSSPTEVSARRSEAPSRRRMAMGSVLAALLVGALGGVMRGPLRPRPRAQDASVMRARVAPTHVPTPVVFVDAGAAAQRVASYEAAPVAPSVAPSIAPSAAPLATSIARAAAPSRPRASTRRVATSTAPSAQPAVTDLLEQNAHGGIIIP